MNKAKSRFIEFLRLTLGATLVSTGIYLFKIPNNFSIGGISGISVILGKLFPAVGAENFVTGLTVIFLVLGFIFVSRDFGWKTVYCSLLFSAELQIFKYAFPLDKPLTDEPMLELVFAVLLPAVGTAILFRHKASTGGTEIVAMILRKFVSVDISTALIAADALVAFSGILVFNIETGLYSVLGLFLKSVLIQYFIEGMGKKKSMMVVTREPEAVCNFITGKLKRGATVWEAHGAYTSGGKSIVLTALNPYQASKLRNYIKSIDADSFTVINNTSEIYGRGFLSSDDIT